MISQRFFVFLILSCILSLSMLIGQSSQFSDNFELIEINIESSPIKSLIEQNEKILMDVDGNLIGSVKGEIIDSVKRFRLTFPNGNSLHTMPYQFTAISKNLSHIIAYGDYSEFDVFYELNIYVYTNDGTLTTSFKSNLYWPYALSINDNGSFILAGCDENDQSTVIRKYLNGGSLVWERKIPKSAELKIQISPKTNYIGIISRDDRIKKRVLYIYDDSGRKLHEEQHPEDYHNFEFIAEQKLVLFSSSKWIIYSLNNKIIKNGFGEFDGTPAGMYPLSGINSSGKFSLLSFAPSRDAYILEIFDSTTGERLSATKIIKEPVWANFRRVKFDESNRLKVYTEDEVLHYSME